jgi:hypothetical protein
MRTNENTTFNEAAKICVMRCYYDAEGEYREEYMEGVEISVLPEKAAARVNLEYDITTLYSQWDVLVVARSISEIDEYKKLGATPHFFHNLLHIGEHDCYDGYRCIVSNFKSLRKWYKNRSQKIS